MNFTLIYLTVYFHGPRCSTDIFFIMTFLRKKILIFITTFADDALENHVPNSVIIEDDEDANILLENINGMLKYPSIFQQKKDVMLYYTVDFYQCLC